MDHAPRDEQTVCPFGRRTSLSRAEHFVRPGLRRSCELSLQREAAVAEDEVAEGSIDRESRTFVAEDKGCEPVCVLQPDVTNEYSFGERA